MTTTSHTPGPWKFQKHQGMTSDINGNPWFTIRDKRNCYIAQLERVDGLTTPKMEANARLLATAPKLLNALRNMAAAVRDNYAAALESLEEANAAIDEAMGEESAPDWNWDSPVPPYDHKTDGDYSAFLARNNCD